MYIDSTYTDGPYSDQSFAALMRAHIEPMLINAGVNLALWGHHHSYQRTCAVVNEVCQETTMTGLVNIVVGTAVTTPLQWHLARILTL